MGRELLQRALEDAVATLSHEADLILRPELDHDTKGVPGAPPIVSAILAKLDTCSILVSDVTLTYKRSVGEGSRPAPNPNVLFETGYALKRLGHERVILLMDDSSGSPEQLPFDLRGSRVIGFRLETAATLAATLKEAIHTVLTTAGPPSDLIAPVSLRMKKHNRSLESDVHEYQLVVDATSHAEEILTPWSAELTFPQSMLLPNHSYPVVRSLDDGRTVVMRITDQMMGGPLYPGESKLLFNVTYRMTHALHGIRATLFPTPVIATLYHGSRRVAREQVLVEQIQQF